MFGCGLHMVVLNKGSVNGKLSCLLRSGPPPHVPQIRCCCRMGLAISSAVCDFLFRQSLDLGGHLHRQRPYMETSDSQIQFKFPSFCLPSSSVSSSSMDRLASIIILDTPAVAHILIQCFKVSVQVDIRQI